MIQQDSSKIYCLQLMSQEKHEFQFKVQYEYKGQSKRQQIFQRIAKNFVLPFWIQNKNLSNFKFEGGKAKKMDLSVIDSRYFKFQNHNNLSLLYHQRQELKEYLSYEQKLTEIQSTLSKNDYSQLKNMISLSYFWVYAQVILNQIIQEQKIIDYGTQKENPIEVGLFQRIIQIQTQGKCNKLRKRYLLLKFPKHEIDAAKYSAKQTNYIIPLQFLDNSFQKEFKKIKKGVEQDGKTQKLVQTEVFERAKNFIQKKQKQKKSRQQKLYKIELQIQTQESCQDVSFQRTIKLKGQFKEMVKLLTISFKIKDPNHFFYNEITQNSDITKKIFKNKEEYNQLSQTRSGNKIDFPFKEYMYKRQKRYFGKHYSLAFQGGGAKGLAYVGAYRALKEIKNKEDSNKQIPVKSIMGSSAGGIIALGVSTGIPEYQLQKICYKMKAIPSTDRFVHNDSKQKDEVDVPRDLYGLEIHLKDIVGEFRDLLDQYGVINKNDFQQLNHFFKSKEFEVIQQKLVRYLQLAAPTIGQILRYDTKEKQNMDKNKNLIQIFKSWMYKGKATQSTVTKVNWEGLLLHGALMKGQAIHNIAAEILLKFFLKMDLQHNQQQLRVKIQDAFLTNRAAKKDQKQKSVNSILKQIEDHKKYGKQLLQLKLSQIQDCSKEQFGPVLITIVNRFLILIQSYCNQSGQNTEKLKVSDIQMKPLIDLLGFKVELQIETFAEYSNKINFQLKRSSEQNANKSATEANYYDKLSNDLEKLREYNLLNSIFNKVNLINPIHFGNGQIYKGNETLEGLLGLIFSKHFVSVNFNQFGRQCRNVDYSYLKKYFLALEGSDAISETFDYFYEVNKKKSKDFNKPQCVQKYQENYKQFISQMKKINMREYYTLTNIQMTCTSVDLDDKVLRFFNHKSTPDLPVCRCVQMTGSFPIGFKAQKWRKQWGYYNIYLSQRRIQVDLTMHEFTDGGLLANFPIKYLDNEDIRRKYFAHQVVQDKTLLYGFGLDFLDASKNILTQSQLSELMESQDQAQIALQDLMSYLLSLPMYPHLVKLGITFLTTKPGPQTRWAAIYHRIVQRIPFLRFVLKIADAYPNADRNLNLQVFQNRVNIHQLQQPYILIEQEGKEKQSIQGKEKQNIQLSNKVNQQYTSQDQFKWNERQSYIDRGLIIQYEKFYSKYIERACFVLSKDKPLKVRQEQKISSINQEKIKASIKQKIDKRTNNIKEKYEILYNQFKQMIKKDPLNLQSLAIHQGKITNKGIDENAMSELLIQSLLYNLRHNSNEKAVKQFNQKYVYYKFLAAQQTQKPQPQNYKPKLNQTNFKKLYEHKEFQQLSNHFNFQNLKDQHYQNLIKQQQKLISNKVQSLWSASLRSGLQKNRFLRFLMPNYQRQRALRKQAYAKRQLLVEEFEEKEKNEYLQKFKEAHCDFSYMKLYDVTASIKRLTQFLFLVIKNQNFKEKENRQKRNERSQAIINLVKFNSFEKLLTNEIFMSKRDKQIEKAKKEGRQPRDIQETRQEIQRKEIGKLTYFQIIKFVQQYSMLKKKITLQKQFKSFMQKYQIRGNEPKEYRLADTMLETIHKQYLCKSLRIAQDETLSKYLSIEKNEFQDLLRHELYKQLQLLGQKEIMKNKEQCFQILKKLNLVQNIQKEYSQDFFKLIYSKLPVSHLIMEETDEEKKQRNGKDTKNKIYPISVQEEERLHDQRVKVRKALFNILIKEKKYAKQLYQKFMQQRTQFYKDLQQHKNSLKYKESILDDESKKLIANKYTKTEEHMLKILKVEAIQFLVNNKIDKKEQLQNSSKQARRLRKLHEALYTDMQNLFLMMKQIMFLLINLQEKSKQSKNQVKLNLALEKQLNTILLDLGHQKGNQIGCLKQMIAQTYYSMHYQFHKNYAHLSDLQVAELDQVSLSNAFLLSFKHIHRFAKIYVLFRNLYAKIKVNIDQQMSKKKQEIKQETQLIKFKEELQRNFCLHEIQLIYHSGRRIDNKIFSLPMFTSDWILTRKSTEKRFKEHIKDILNHQNNPKFTKIMTDERARIFNKQLQKNLQPQTKAKDEAEKLNKKLEQIQKKNRYQDIIHKATQKLGKLENKQAASEISPSHYDTARSLELIEKIVEVQKNEPFAHDDFDSHLVLEGVSTANECVGAYYYIVRDLVKMSKLKLKQAQIIKRKEQGLPEIVQHKKHNQQQEQYIKAITCSNFHSIFGFLLVLGKDAETIRKEMYNLKFAAAVTENQQNINAFFDKQQFFHNTPNKYAQVLKYLQQQTKGIFEQLQVKNKLKYGQNSFKKEFSDLRLIFQHEKDALMKMYEKILDETSEEICSIDSTYLHQRKVLQISKKFAFNYTCHANKLHNYKEISEQSIKMFNYIAGLVYKSFGQLLTGIIAYYLSNSSLLPINKANASFIIKGIISQRLFTTYRLKQFIIKQLKEAHLSPSITLSEFFSIKRTIFLNFTVVNIDDQRLEFLNKVTTPHMPVWAAIIASSSMPFFHKFFEANKQWEATSSENFYSFIIDDFFRQNDKANNKTHEAGSRITNYLSANYISSLPLELLTNTAVTKIMFPDDKIRYLKFFAIAFNKKLELNSIPDMIIPKTYLSLAWKDKFKLMGIFVGKKMGSYLRNTSFYAKFGAAAALAIHSKKCHFQGHKNKIFNIEYPLTGYIKSFLGHGTLMKTNQTLTESNDNFILKWYYSKLIRLPIRIGTLDFHEIVDNKIKQNYNINLPSVKAKETIERSYEITSSFINSLKDEETIKKEKYLAKFRVQIISVHHQITGFTREQLKLSFLNHSKWNQNRYNNFVIEYSTVVHGVQPKFKRAVQSEILWLVEESSKLKIRFYYPRFNQENPKQSKIIYTEMVMNFEDLVKRLPLKHSFDYQVIFGQDKIAQQTFANKSFNLQATKMNGIELTKDQTLFKKIDDQSNENNKLLLLPQIKCEVVGNTSEIFQSYYIQRSSFTGPKE